MSSLIARSQEFHAKLGISTPPAPNRFELLKGRGGGWVTAAEAHPKTARLLLPDKVAGVLREFIIFKKLTASNEVERRLYADPSKARDLAFRLFAKRPISFFGRGASTRLRGGTALFDARDAYASIKSGDGLVKLEEYISSEEMLLSSFVAPSSLVFFVNDGALGNDGKAGGEHGVQGICVGLTMPSAGGGPFPSQEDQFMIVRPDSNEERGFGIAHGMLYSKSNTISYPDPLGPVHWQQVWYELYHHYMPTGEDYSGKKRIFFPSYTDLQLRTEAASFYTKYGEGESVYYFNHGIYVKRLVIAMETFLFECNQRAATVDKPAYVYLPLFPTMALPGAKDDLEKSFALALKKALYEHAYNNIGTIHVAGVTVAVCREFLRGLDEEREYGPPSMLIEFSMGSALDAIQWTAAAAEISEKRAGVPLPFTVESKERAPAQRARGKLLCVAYPQPANAFPGNEYWSGIRTASLSGAVAAASTLGEMLNVEINTENLNGPQSVYTYYFPNVNQETILRLYKLADDNYSKITSSTIAEEIPETVNAGYGEMTMESLDKIIDVFARLGLDKNSEFYDIGSGQGVPAMHVFLKTGARSVGVEYVTARVDTSNNIKSKLARYVPKIKDMVTFTQGDAKADDFAIPEKATFVYSYDLLNGPRIEGDRSVSQWKPTKKGWTDYINRALVASKFKYFASALPPFSSGETRKTQADIELYEGLKLVQTVDYKMNSGPRLANDSWALSDEDKVEETGTMYIYMRKDSV